MKTLLPGKCTGQTSQTWDLDNVFPSSSCPLGWMVFLHCKYFNALLMLMSLCLASYIDTGVSSCEVSPAYENVKYISYELDNSNSTSKTVLYVYPFVRQNVCWGLLILWMSWWEEIYSQAWFVTKHREIESITQWFHYWLLLRNAWNGYKNGNNRSRSVLRGNVGESQRAAATCQCNLCSYSGH